MRRVERGIGGRALVLVYAVLGAAAGLAMIPAEARSQQQDQEPERVQEARLARTGAGLRIAYWRVQDLPEVQDGTDSRWPLIEAYHERGLDRHLALGSTVGLWRRRVESESGGVIGSGTGTAVTTWVVPLLTTLRFHPFTGPEAGTEPYLGAGGGVALGIEEREGGGLTGGGTSVETAFALKGEAGTAIRLGDVFGLNLFAGYQWLRFGADFGGARTHAGFNFGGGLTYRFQY